MWELNFAYSYLYHKLLKLMPKLIVTLNTYDSDNCKLFKLAIWFSQSYIGSYSYYGYRDRDKILQLGKIAS